MGLQIWTQRVETLSVVLDRDTLRTYYSFVGFISDGFTDLDAETLYVVLDRVTLRIYDSIVSFIS